MLDVMRRGSKTWVAKALMLLLVLSFGIWGIAGYTSGVGSTAAVTVGETEVGVDAVVQQFRQDLANLRRRGMDLTPQQALQMGLLGRTLRGIVDEAVLKEAVRRYGLTVSDDTLRAEIHKDPRFLDEQGRFDRQRMRDVLARNQLSEDQYVELRRGDMARAALLDPVVGSAAAPKAVVDRLAAYQSERRTGTLLRVNANALTLDDATPDDEALKATYDANLPQFTAPQYRTFSTLVVTTEDVMDEVTVPEEDIKAQYDANPDFYTAAETRTVTQALFPDEDTAAKARAMIDDGATLAEATSAVGGTGPVAMGAITRESLPAPLPDTIFAQPVGPVGTPVQSALGWHLFQVSAKDEGGTKPLEEVHDEIRQSLAADKALDALYALSAQVEDTLAGGATLEEAAEGVGLTTLSGTVDQQGTTPDGSPMTGLPAGEDFLTDLFAQETGVAGALGEFDNGFYLTRVDEVIPPAAKPLEEVRSAVVALWQAGRRQEAAAALAADLAEKANEGTTLPALAEESPAVTLETVGPVNRTGQGSAEQTVPRPVIQALFATEKGKITTVALPDGGEAVLRVSSVTAPAADLAQREKSDIAQVLRQAYGADLSSQYTQAMADAIGVEINEGLLARAFDEQN